MLRTAITCLIVLSTPAVAQGNELCIKMAEVGKGIAQARDEGVERDVYDSLFADASPVMREIVMRITERAYETNRDITPDEFETLLIGECL